MFSLEKLFELVKSLTSSEKRLLRLHASIQSGKKNYMQLFEILEEMEQFDTELFQQLYDEKKYKFNISGAQTYLVEKILDMLCIAQQQDFIEARLNKLLLESKIMEQRGFYDLAYYLLKKAKKLAKKHNIHYVLLEILIREARIISNIETKELKIKFQTIFDEVEHSLEQLKEENYYRSKSYWLLSYSIKTRSTAKQEEQKLIQETIKREVQDKIVRTNNFYAKLFYYKIITRLFYLNSESKNWLETGLEQIEFLERHPQMMKTELQEYIIAVSGTIHPAIDLHEDHQIPPLFEKLDGLTPKTFYEKAYLFQTSTGVKLYYYINREDYKSAQLLASDIEEKLPQYQHLIKQSRILTIYYNLSLAFFFGRDYDQAHHWLEKILSIKKTDETRKDILRFARIFHLILFYQMEQLNLLDGLVRSVTRNKLVKELMLPFDKLVLKTFKKLISYPSRSQEAKDLLQELFQKLHALPQKQKKITGFEETIIWLERLCGVEQEVSQD
jgi:hypothetical protein